MSVTPCPECGSTDHRRGQAGVVICNDCGARFSPEAGSPPQRRPASQGQQGSQTPPAGETPLAEPHPSAGWGSTVGLLALTAAALLGVWWSTSAPGDATDAVHDPQDALAERLRGQIVGTSRGQTPDGVPFWLLTYRNDGELPIRSPTVELRWFNEAGLLLGRERVTAAAPDVLPPGREIPLRVIAPQLDLDAEPRLQIVPPSLAQAPSQLKEVGVRHLRGSDSTVTGTISPLDDEAVRLVHLAVVGRRQDGRVVAWAEHDLTDLVLPPGKQVRFRAEVGPWTTFDAEVWTAHAWGEPVFP